MPANFLTLDEFKLVFQIQAEEKVRAIFATYNSVGRYENGELETGVENLSIVVQSGNLIYSPLTYVALGGALVSSTLLRGGVRTAQSLMEFEAAEAQQPVIEAVSKIDVSDDTKLVVFIYTGLSGFSGSAELAEKVRENHPNAIIVLTMCDCGVRTHSAGLIDLVENGTANYLVYDNECGGYRLMNDLLKYLLEIYGAHSLL